LSKLGFEIKDGGKDEVFLDLKKKIVYRNLDVKINFLNK